MQYNAQAIEQKWRKRWEENPINEIEYRRQKTLLLLRYVPISIR